MIEIIIVMVSVSILMTLAYPSYKNYLLKSHRSDAFQTLIHDQMILERCYAQHFSYNTDCSALPSFPHISLLGYYTIALSDNKATTYSLTATPVGPQAQDTLCAILTVNQANVRSAFGSSGATQAECWQ